MFNIIFTMLLETTKLILGRIAWRVIFERFYTRLLVFSLYKIKELSTNDVVDNTVQDIINSLQGKRLKVIDELNKTKG